MSHTPPTTARTQATPHRTQRTRNPRTSERRVERCVGRRPPHSLERQAIGFTIGLYLFISISLLTLHYAAPYMPQGGSCESSSTSPFNPC